MGYPWAGRPRCRCERASPPCPLASNPAPRLAECRHHISSRSAATKLEIGTIERTPDIKAIPARRMQKDQHQAGHTIPLSHSGRQASSRRPCCHKESAVTFRLPNLAVRESTVRYRHFGVSENSFSALPIEALPNQRACRQSCDRACCAWCLGSSQSKPTSQPSWPWPRQE